MQHPIEPYRAHLLAGELADHHSALGAPDAVFGFDLEGTVL